MAYSKRRERSQRVPRDKPYGAADESACGVKELDVGQLCLRHFALQANPSGALNEAILKVVLVTAIEHRRGDRGHRRDQPGDFTTG